MFAVLATDYALVRYKVGPMMELVYHALKNYLIEHKKYPAEYLDKPFDATFW